MEDGIASGGSGATPDWNENDSMSPSYIANRPFYTDPWIDTYIFSTSNAITFTYNADSELPSGGYYSGTYTVNTVNDTDYSNMKIGIELLDGNENVIMSNYDMYFTTGNLFTTESYPHVEVQRTTSNSSTEYTIEFWSKNIGDTIDASVYFGIVQEDIITIDPKYLGKNGIIRVGLEDDGSTITLSSSNNYFKSLDELSAYLASGGYVYLEQYYNVYTMIDNSGTNIDTSDTFVFKGNDGVIEYDRNTQEFTFYPLTAYINKKGGSLVIGATPILPKQCDSVVNY